MSSALTEALAAAGRGLDDEELAALARGLPDEQLAELVAAGYARNGAAPAQRAPAAEPRARPRKAPPLDDREAALAAVGSGAYNPKTVAKAIGCHPTTASKVLAQLAKRKRVRREGHGRGLRYSPLEAHT